jgi:hypothetical protein
MIGLFVFATRFEPAPKATQLPIKWVPAALNQGVKRPGREADQLPQSSSEIKNAWSYTYTFPIRLYGMVLN